MPLPPMRLRRAANKSSITLGIFVRSILSMSGCVEKWHERPAPKGLVPSVVLSFGVSSNGIVFNEVAVQNINSLERNHYHRDDRHHHTGDLPSRRPLVQPPCRQQNR